MPVFGYGKIPSDKGTRDYYAGHLADSLMNVFAASVFCAFLVVGGLIYGAFNHKAAEISNVSSILKEALDVVRLVGALFSPLLAFVLGYYFNQSAQAAAKLAGADAGQRAGGEAGVAAGAAAGAMAGRAVIGNEEPPDMGPQEENIDSSTAKIAGAVAGEQAGTKAGAQAGAQAGADVIGEGEINEKFSDEKMAE